MGTLEFYFETIAGSHLQDAVDALRDSGSADTLHDEPTRTTPASEQSFEWAQLAEQIAEGKRVALSRRALLYAAFAAEAYINECLWERLATADRDALDRLATVEKFMIVPRLAFGRAVLDRGTEPGQRLRWLFKRRDELVHPKPRKGPPRLEYHPEAHNPTDAARCIVAVAHAATVLEPEGPDPMSLIARVGAARGRLLEYGARASGRLPRPNEQPEPLNLLRQND